MNYVPVFLLFKFVRLPKPEPEESVCGRRFEWGGLLTPAHWARLVASGGLGSKEPDTSSGGG